MEKRREWLVWLALACVSGIGSISASAQNGFGILHSFANVTTDGALPESQPLLIASNLVGVTFYGGDSGNGCVFQVGTNGANFSLLYSFEGGVNGANPFGLLASNGPFLYGMTFNGGVNDGGVLFRVGIDGVNYAVLHTFMGGSADGQFPLGGLTGTGSVLYGMTTGGGTNGVGVVFKISTNGSSFAVLHSFQGGLNDGSSPSEGVTLGGSNLFGTTFYGGSNNLGTVFSVVTNGTGYKVLHHFAGHTNDGANPSGPVTLDGSSLYGITSTGGTNGAGAVFKINTDGSGYTVLHHFAGGANDGAFPQFGPLIVANALIYGATEEGGPTNAGVVFQMATNGTSFALLHSFSTNANEGAFPFYPPILSGSSFYGLTVNGGSNDLGVVYGPTATVSPPPQVCTNNIVVPSTQSSGIFFGNVVAGVTYAYTASGCVLSGGPNNSDPDGNLYSDSCQTLIGSNQIADTSYICPGLKVISLVGKIGGFCIQLGKSGTFVVPESGPLTLYYNDGNFGDNSGSFDACITPVPQLCTNVPGNSAGTAIGNVVGGLTYVYSASGCVKWGNFNQFSEPDGTIYSNNCTTFVSSPFPATGFFPPFPCPDSYWASLVGTINGGPCIQLGNSGTFVAYASGTLSLFCNDNDRSDNGGSWDVCIEPIFSQIVCSNVPAITEAGTSFGTIYAGQRYYFTATGSASFDCLNFVDADGLPNGAGVTDTNVHCSTLHPWSLVGEVNGTCIQLGTSGSFAAPSTGELFLLMNDDVGLFGNNCGAWYACLTPIGDFRITAIAAASDDLLLTWNTYGGITNAVQVNPGDAKANYNTNNFADLGALIVIPGTGPTVTNYIEVGGATNYPTRYYRVRLVP